MRWEIRYANGDVAKTGDTELSAWLAYLLRRYPPARQISGYIFLMAVNQKKAEGITSRQVPE